MIDRLHIHIKGRVVRAVFVAGIALAGCPDDNPSASADAHGIPDTTTDTSPSGGADTVMRDSFDDAREPPRDIVADASMAPDTTSGNDTGTSSSFVPAPLPALVTTPGAEPQPLWFFLYMHTEDHINHALSEDRYRRLLSVVAGLAEAHPDAGLTWTIEFQGADAKTVHERNATTGIADLIRTHAETGLVEFGYHAHHDPTYMNRPQRTLRADAGWAAWVEAMDTWISCEKDPVRGGCIDGNPAPEGGLLAIENNFGPVRIISGLYSDSEAGIEGDASVHAVRRYLPERRLGFGYPDHGSTATGDHRANLAALMRDLTPSIHTSGTMFWMDDILRINDGNPVDGAKSLNVQRGQREVAGQLERLDRTHPNVLLSHIGSKYLYTKDRFSPTQYAYANPDAPELTANELKTSAEIEQAYASCRDTLTWMVEDVVSATGATRFVKSSEVLAAIDTEDFRQITRAELDVMARWALLNWDGKPPSWVSDGHHFYSLRDLFNLLALALAGRSEPYELPVAYGPLVAIDAPNGVVLNTDDLKTTAASWAANLQQNAPWQVTPSNLLPNAMPVGRVGEVPLAQVLFGFAWVYASEHAGQGGPQVSVPVSEGAPAIRERLRALNCQDCSAGAWSIKPAVVDLPP